MSIEDVEINSCMFRQTDRQTDSWIHIHHKLFFKALVGEHEEERELGRYRRNFKRILKNKIVGHALD